MIHDFSLTYKRMSSRTILQERSALRVIFCFPGRIVGARRMASREASLCSFLFFLSTLLFIFYFVALFASESLDPFHFSCTIHVLLVVVVHSLLSFIRM